MTGAYLRVKRDDTFQSIEVEYLTPEERGEIFKTRNQEEVMRWMDMLCKTLVQAEKMQFSQ